MSKPKLIIEKRELLKWYFEDRDDSHYFVSKIFIPSVLNGKSIGITELYNTLGYVPSKIVSDKCVLFDTDSIEIDETKYDGVEFV